MQHAPLCYSSTSSRFSMLRGKWTRNQSHRPTYSNLSCALEWSKYSCVHQGAVEHAAAAASLSFEPEDGCRLLTLSNRHVLPPGWRAWLIGDSLIRQLLISIGCSLGRAVTRTRVSWPECHLKQAWPCHHTRNCIECGEHSGAEIIELELASGASLHFLGESSKSHLPPVRTLRATDVVIVQPGIHDEGLARVSAAVKTAQLLNLTVVWVITPQDAFASPKGHGIYNRSFLTEKRRPSTPKLDDEQCDVWTPPTRSQHEWSAIRSGRYPEFRTGLAGVVELDGLNGLGDAKVGRGVGAHGDCAHYCMPGPPDVLARAVITMLAQLLSLAKVV